MKIKGLNMLNKSEVEKLYPDGPLMTGKKVYYSSSRSPEHRIEIVKYSFKHSITKACAKFDVCKSTLTTWITEYNNSKVVY